MRGLTDKVCVVTGGGQGIGAAIARRLASEGMAVLIADISVASGDIVAEEIRAEGGKAVALAVDVRDEEALRGTAAHANESFGAEPGLYICNAGYQSFASIDEIDDAQWHAVLDVNAHGTFRTMRAASESFRRTGTRGSIITVASIQARIGSVHYAHYSASKAAVLSLTKSFALTMAPLGVRVNCVAPGVIDTDLWAKADREIAALRGVQPGVPRAERIAQVPLGRPGTPEDVAGAVAFLASEDASYITGECLHVCGGDIML